MSFFIGLEWINRYCHKETAPSWGKTGPVLTVVGYGGVSSREKILLTSHQDLNIRLTARVANPLFYAKVFNLVQLMCSTPVPAIALNLRTGGVFHDVILGQVMAYDVVDVGGCVPGPLANLERR